MRTFYLMSDQRKNIGYILVLVTLLIFLLGNFLGVHAERIYGAGQTPNHFIGSAHVHANLFALTSLVFIGLFITSLNDLEWPKYFTESSLISLVIGTILFPTNMFLKALGMFPLSGYFSTSGAAFFIYGTIVYTICFGIGATFGGDN